VLFRTFQRISIAEVLANMRRVPTGTLMLAAACTAGGAADARALRDPSWCAT